jgi:quercetin dioxygenase-like cupin family protein
MSENRPRSTQTVQIDNDRVYVSESRFPPGATTGWHRHDHDYVVVPLTTARLRVVTAAGEAFNELVTGQAYFRTAGVEHEVINDNPFEVVFVETEVK